MFVCKDRLKRRCDHQCLFISHLCMRQPYTNRYTKLLLPFDVSNSWLRFAVESSQVLTKDLKLPWQSPGICQPLPLKSRTWILYCACVIKSSLNLSFFRYTSKDNHVFAIALKWPRSGRLVLGDVTPTSKTRVRMLDTEKNLKWTHRSEHKNEKTGIVIHVPAIPVSELPCLWAWVFKLSHIEWPRYIFIV